MIGIVSAADQAELAMCFTTVADKAAVQRLSERSQCRRSAGVPADARTALRVPWLSVRVGSELEMFDEDHFLSRPWDVGKCDITLTEKELPSRWRAGETGEIDVTQKGTVEMTRFVSDLHEQISLISGECGWDVPTLATWIDRNIRHPDIGQHQSAVFIHRLVSDLIDRRCVSVEQLARIKFRLRDAVEGKIAEHRAAHRDQSFQAFLFGPEAETRVVVDPKNCFTFDEEHYAPNWYYTGGYNFQRHCVRYVGELKSDGEEFECAVAIDEMDETEVWLRNLPRRPSSFWLPTSTDRFYPDFVVLLRDGRILVVEYKGGDRATADDAKEKKAVGEMWAARSRGRCLFVMPVARDWRALRAFVDR